MLRWIARTWLVAAVAIVTAAAVRPVRASSLEAPPGVDFANLFGAPFTLTDQDGKPRRDTDFLGRYVLVYFGYTFCPDICPTNLQEIEAALDLLGDSIAAEGVFITLDPARDTPDVLKAYVASFGEGITGLTGSEEDTAALACAYRLHRVKVVPEWSSGDDDYLVDHSSLTFLIGPDGKVLTLFPHATPGEVIAGRVRGYMARNGL